MPSVRAAPGYVFMAFSMNRDVLMDDEVLILNIKIAIL
jgi:hypothetical protein